jgi:hypothetical protein
LKAGDSFESKRQIIDLLDVRVTLAVEDGQKVAYARCLIEDETELPIVSNTTGTACWQVGEVTVTTNLRGILAMINKVRYNRTPKIEYLASK